MRSCVTSTQSLTPISWPTYLCISFGWPNSLFAISYLGAAHSCFIRYRQPPMTGPPLGEGAFRGDANCIVAGFCPSCHAQECTLGSPWMAYETVLYDVADRICTISLNRPERLNAWTRQMHLDLK